jgi:hypothetical protein
MIRSLIGLSSLALIATKNNRRKSPGTIVNGSAATYPTNIELIKPNGAAYVVTNLSEFMRELLAASPGWKEMGRKFDVSQLFQFIFDPNHPRKEGITTNPEGRIVFLWRNLDAFGQTPNKGGYTQDFVGRLIHLQK